MNDQFFADIASRYGISVSALRDAWDKSRTDDIKLHVKRFKAYLTALTGSDSGNNISLPEMTDEVQESIVVAFVGEDAKAIFEIESLDDIN